MMDAQTSIGEEEKSPEAPAKSKSEFRQRVIYSILMMGGGLAAAIIGPPYWGFAAAFVMAVTAHEWGGVAGATLKVRRISIIVSAICGLLFVIGPEPVRVAACVGFAAALSIASIRGGIVGILGSTYIALCGFAFTNLRLYENGLGLLWIFGLFAVVWATDSSAYGFGRWLKGPKLMPSASPNKTWSGFVGGILAGTAAAGLYSVLANMAFSISRDEELTFENLFKTFTPWLIVGFFLAIACQLGDLIESVAKRHFGVKDTSSLIPGHGGLLDRLDGHFAVALLLQIFVLIPQISEHLY